MKVKALRPVLLRLLPAEPLRASWPRQSSMLCALRLMALHLLLVKRTGRGYVVLSVDGVEQPEARADLNGNGQFVIFAFLPVDS